MSSIEDPAQALILNLSYRDILTKFRTRGGFKGANYESVVKFTKDVQPRVVLARFSLHQQYNLIEMLCAGDFEGADSESVVKFTKDVQPRVVLARFSLH